MATQGDKAPARPALKRSTVGLSAEDAEIVRTRTPDLLVMSSSREVVVATRALEQGRAELLELKQVAIVVVRGAPAACVPEDSTPNCSSHQVAAPHVSWTLRYFTSSKLRQRCCRRHKPTRMARRRWRRQRRRRASHVRRDVRLSAAWSSDCMPRTLARR